MQGIILSFIFYNIIIFSIYSHYKRGEYEIPTKQFLFYTLLFIAFGTYGNHIGDYYRINEMIEFYGQLSYSDYGISMEPQYYKLAQLVNGNFVLWRFAINVIAFGGLFYFLKKAEMDNYPTLMLFAALCMFWVAGHRGWWGYIYFYFGVYLLYKQKNPLFLISIALAYFSHASALLLLALTPLSLLKFNKYVALAGILSISLAVGFFQNIFDVAIGGGVENEYYAEKLDSYSSQTVSNFFGASIGENLQRLFSMGPQYVFYFYLVYQLIKNGIQPHEKGLNGVLMISVVLFFASLVAMFMNMGSGTIAYRIFSMSTFPIIILSSFVFSSCWSKNYKRMIYCGVISIELLYAFTLYYMYMHPGRIG